MISVSTTLLQTPPAYPPRPTETRQPLSQQIFPAYFGPNRLRANSSKRVIGTPDSWGYYTFQDYNDGDPTQLRRCFLSKLSCNTLPSCRPKCFAQWETTSAFWTAFGYWSLSYIIVDPSGTRLDVTRSSVYTKIANNCNECIKARLPDGQIGSNPYCAACDQLYKDTCFQGCVRDQCFPKMQALMTDLAEALLYRGVSLYLDFEDGPAEEYLAKRRNGGAWDRDTVARVNQFLSNRVALAEKLVFMPSSTGDFCIAELAASHHTPTRGHTVIPSVQFSDIVQWMGAVRKFSVGDKEELLDLVQGACTGTITL